MQEQEEEEKERDGRIERRKTSSTHTLLLLPRLSWVQLFCLLLLLWVSKAFDFPLSLSPLPSPPHRFRHYHTTTYFASLNYTSFLVCVCVE